MESSIEAIRPGDNDLRRELRDRFANEKVALPLLSESVQRVLSAASNEATDARMLSEIIKRDQALAGHVLRVANSPIYAPASPIVSLQQAVSRLGMRQVREVALLISMQTRVFEVKGYEADLKALFRHAIATALFAQEVARSRRRNVEEAFLGGLLHDVGKPVVLQAIMDSKSPQARAVRTDKADVWSVVHDLHGLAGRALASAWSLPASLGDMIAAHHDVSSASAAVHITGLADDLAHLALGDSPIDEATVRTHPFAALLNLYPEDVDKLLAKRADIAVAAGGFS